MLELSQCSLERASIAQRSVPAGSTCNRPAQDVKKRSVQDDRPESVLPIKVIALEKTFRRREAMLKPH